jgi:hypothetical protein
VKKFTIIEHPVYVKVSVRGDEYVTEKKDLVMAISHELLLLEELGEITLTVKYIGRNKPKHSMASP